MANKIILNETSYFGRESRKELINELKARNFKKVLVITDRPLIDAKVTEMVTKELEMEKIPYEIYSKIKSNPTVENVKEGVNICKSTNADVLVAVGGGSVIDTAKCISIVMTNKEFEDIISLDGMANTKNKGLPLITLPTTAGTAAEVTINYVITDMKNTKKMVCVDPHDIPVVAIIDQELMDKMPKKLKAETGMDALTHAIEGYLTKASWLMTDMFHLNAMALIFKNLEKAVNEEDKESLDNVAYGQYIAGMGFSNVGLGIVHSMAHSLGAYYDTPHGLANAILLPYVLKFNGKVCPELFKNMAGALNLEIDGLADNEIVDKFVMEIRRIAENIGIPKTLKEIGIKKEDLEKLANQAINDVCTTGNPRETTKEDILNIYKEAYE
ncbi:MAG: lactaldehyde reductase [Bacilli bacterium]|nr:lactaldehyde reductase [Bacilli bacterium]